jgi:hypothetical protein
MKVQMKDRQIPRRGDGYPAFERLIDRYLGDHDQPDRQIDDKALLAIFTPAEIVELVNRALYQLEYQKTAHGKYQQRQRDFQAPVKLALRELFPGVSWIKATPEQVKLAMEKAYPKEGK